MILARTALELDRVRQAASTPAVAGPELTDDERVALDYLDATVESGIYRSFDGNIFDIRVPAKFCSPSVIEALKLRYEEGGWSVGVFPVRYADEVTEFQVVFSAGRFTDTTPGRHAEPEPQPQLPPRPRPSASRPPPVGKPRVCLVSDVPNWAFDQNMRDLAAYLSDEFDFEHFFTENWFRGARPDWDRYDVIYEAYHRNPPMGIPLSRAVGALRSQWFKPETMAPPDAEDIAMVNGYRAFQVAARRNFEELKDRCLNAVYLTNPVNVRRFERVQPLRGSVVVEWNGNAGHKSMDGRTIKHFHDVVVPACAKAGVPLVSAEYGIKEGPNRQRSFAEMPEFYAQASVAVCASEYEAASNSVMESMAAGLAVVATDCGNHREMRDSQLGHFGQAGIILIEADWTRPDSVVAQFASALQSLTPEKVSEMGAINRAEIKERWSWDAWRERYASFLKKAL